MIHLFAFGSINRNLDNNSTDLLWVPNWAAKRRRLPYLEDGMLLGMHEQARALELEDRVRLENHRPEFERQRELQQPDSPSSASSHQQPQDPVDQHTSWWRELNRYSGTAILAPKGEVMEVRWTDTEGDMYGRVVDQVFKLVETQDQ